VANKRQAAKCYEKFIQVKPSGHTKYDLKAPRPDRQQNMVMSPVEIGTTNHRAGEEQQEFSRKSLRTFLTWTSNKKPPEYGAAVVTEKILRVTCEQ
jgi:hypothetical protein